VDATTYALVNHIAVEPSWKNAKTRIASLSDHNLNDDEISLKNALHKCLRCGLTFCLDEASMKGYTTLVQTILDRFVSCELTSTVLHNHCEHSDDESRKLGDHSSAIEENANNTNNNTNNSDPIANDWLVQMFLDNQFKIDELSLMDMLTDCMKRILRGREQNRRNPIEDSESESESDEDDEEVVRRQTMDSKWWIDGMERLHCLYEKWSEEPYLSIVIQNEEFKKFLLRLFHIFTYVIQTKDQLVKSYRIYYLSLPFEIVRLTLFFNYYGEIESENMEKLFVSVPLTYYSRLTQHLALDLIRNEFLAKREQYNSVEDIWRNSTLTVALYVILNSARYVPHIKQLPSYLFPIRGTIDDSYSSLIYLSLLHFGMRFDNSVQEAHKADIQLILTQGLKSNNVDRRILCIFMLDKLCCSVFAEMFESLKPILWYVVKETTTNSDELGEIAGGLTTQAERALQKQDFSLARSIIQFIFDIAFEFRDDSDLKFCYDLSLFLSNPNVKIESDKLVVYLNSLTTTLENREKEYFSNPDDESRDKLTQVFCALEFIPEMTVPLDDDTLCRFHSVLYRCLPVESISYVCWSIYTKAIENDFLDGMEAAHKRSTTNTTSLFHYTLSLICQGSLDPHKLRTGRKLWLHYYQEQTREELELLHEQLLPPYLEKLIEGLFISTDDFSRQEAFLSLGLLYCGAPDMVRNSSSDIVENYLEYFDGYLSNITQSKPNNVACWLAFLELSYDHLSADDEDDISLILEQLFGSEVYLKNQQVFQPLASRLLVASCSQKPNEQGE